MQRGNVCSQEEGLVAFKKDVGIGQLDPAGSN